MPPPELLNTGEDSDAIVRSLLAYVNWMRAHNPDPSLLGEVADADWLVFEELERDITLLHEHNMRYYETERPMRVSFERYLGPIRELGLHYEGEATGFLVNASGEIVQQIAVPGEEPVEIQIRRGDDDRWRISRAGVQAHFNSRRSERAESLSHVAAILGE